MTKSLKYYYISSMCFYIWFSNGVKKAEEEIEEQGVLSDENAIPVLLKAQFKHIAHLDTDLC